MTSREPDRSPPTPTLATSQPTQPPRHARAIIRNYIRQRLYRHTLRTPPCRPTPPRHRRHQQSPPSGGTRFAANSLPLHVRAEGLDLSGLRPGLLYAWARTTTGGWLGFVQATITTGNGRDTNSPCVNGSPNPRSAPRGHPMTVHRADAILGLVIDIIDDSHGPFTAREITRATRP